MCTSQVSQSRALPRRLSVCVFLTQWMFECCLDIFLERSVEKAIFVRLQDHSEVFSYHCWLRQKLLTCRCSLMCLRMFVLTVACLDDFVSSAHW